ncbi:TetR/AcrR family transcriptional regulator [Parafrankia elaeagni]|uniref:TetR/AcrR family transcriptional regulator n=1 Tax=Parafrankia elaeagni TaxID=222534 RepID=UPI0003691A63|nr:TetR/AcrR family transcriptional regulator [Parafrankia elaeagni]
MATSADTPQRILSSAFTVLARLGSQRLTMADISRQSGLSRGTVYRYFSTKDEVLAALATHLRTTFETQLNRMIASQPGLDRRVDVVVEHLLSFTHDSEFLNVVDVDPWFVRSFLADHIDELITPVARALAPAAGSVRQDLARLDPWQVAEIVVRLAASYQQVPQGCGSDASVSLRDATRSMLGCLPVHTATVPAQGARPTSHAPYFLSARTVTEVDSPLASTG